MRKRIHKFCIEANPGSAAAELVRAQAKNTNAFKAEAMINESDRSVEVIIISEGPGNEVDKNYYTPEAMDSGVELFEGARAFINHQTEGERNSRPEQDVHQLCGFYRSCKTEMVFDPRQGKNVKALTATLVCDESESGDLAFSKAKAQILFARLYPNSKECYAGISVNTGGWQDGEVEIAGDKWAKIVAFEGVQSADIVTRPGRGGAFLRFAESLGPEGSNNMKESDVKNADKMKKLVAKLEESDKAIKKETGAAMKAKLVAEAEKLRAEIQKLISEADSDESLFGKDGNKEAADDAAADPAAGDGDAKDKAMAALKKHMAQTEGESEEDYTGRVKQAFKAAEAAGIFGKEEAADDGDADDETPAKKQESNRMRESAVVVEFRKKSPNQYRAMMGALRESLGAERLDFKGLKEDNATLRTEVSTLRLERDLAEAERVLQESGIPTQYLAPADLVRLDESARTRLIERTKLIMEGSGSAHVWSGTGPGSEGKKSIELDFGSLPTVEEKK